MVAIEEAENVSEGLHVGEIDADVGKKGVVVEGTFFCGYLF